MRRRVLMFVLIGMTLFLLPGQPKLTAATGWEKHWDIYETCNTPCMIGPPCTDVLVGQWDVDCDEHVTGWGVEPNSGCPYRTDVTYGAYCGTP
jgi:hypothetical protein